MLTRIRALFYRVMFPVAKLFVVATGLKRNGSMVIISRGLDILLIKNTYGSGYWTFPGGTVKRGELPENAARREVFEEVGISLGELRPVSSVSSKYGIVYVFVGDSLEDKLVLDKGEISDAKWIMPGQIKESDLSDIGVAALRNFKNYQKNIKK